MNDATDTITAIATAPGEGGIAIIRLSGPACYPIADRIVHGTTPLPSQRSAGSFFHTTIASDPQQPDTDLDEAIVLLFRAPKSYTCEDVIEIQCHGGRVPAQRILQQLVAAGARLADPGEFTRRAFLNGRIDLLQAEAVMDLIRARSDRAAASAMDQLDGSLSSSITTLYDLILEVCSDLEASLDFSESELPASSISSINDRLEQAHTTIETLLADWNEGHYLREGARVVITGEPNAGKSTLLNALVGSERAIVTPIAGTTRDFIEEQLIIDGIPLRLIDTAGLRTTECEVEQAGVERAHHHARRADVNLVVIDASAPVSESMGQHVAQLPSPTTLVVLNKCDLGDPPPLPHSLAAYSSLQTSLLDHKGIDALRHAITKTLGLVEQTPPHAVISERHRAALITAHGHLQAAIAMMRDDTMDHSAFAASDLRLAAESIGEITGACYSDDLLDTIFARFCIGK
jgi:tRNA modification GTPase